MASHAHQAGQSNPASLGQHPARTNGRRYSRIRVTPSANMLLDMWYFLTHDGASTKGSPRPEGGPENRTGMRAQKKEAFQFHPLWVEPLCCRKTGPECGPKKRTAFIRKFIGSGLRFTAGFLANVMIICDLLSMKPPAKPLHIDGHSTIPSTHCSCISSDLTRPQRPAH